MRLLIPDLKRSEAQRPDMIWCVPVSSFEFSKLCKLADKFKGYTQNGVPYLHSIGKGRKQIILVLWDQQAHNEGDITEACAWIRLIKDKQQPIYITPCEECNAELTQAEVINRSVGVLPDHIQSLDSIEFPPPTSEEGSR